MNNGPLDLTQKSSGKTKPGSNENIYLKVLAFIVDGILFNLRYSF